MSIEQEGTIETTLDRLNEQPAIIFGLSINELLILFGSAAGSSLPIWMLALWFFLDAALMGVGGAVITGVISVPVIGKRVAIMKKGRPSQLFWVDVKKNLQKKIGMNFGMIETACWDIKSSKTEKC